MARNEEKQLGRLNRLHLKKLHDDYEKKNPRRPKLESLNSTNDIRQWIPSIKKDIDFCLKQLQVPCYPERKIAEINVRITHLQGEYKAFVRKLREIDPNMKEIPWQERSYQDRKRKNLTDVDCVKNEVSKGKVPRSSVKAIDVENRAEDNNQSDFVPLTTPVLDTDYANMFGYHSDSMNSITDLHTESQNKPLCFNHLSTGDIMGTDNHGGRKNEPLRFNHLISGDIMRTDNHGSRQNEPLCFNHLCTGDTMGTDNHGGRQNEPLCFNRLSTGDIMGTDNHGGRQNEPLCFKHLCTGDTMGTDNHGGRKNEPLCFNRLSIGDTMGTDNHGGRQNEQVRNLSETAKTLNIPYSDSESESSNQ